MMLYPAMKDLLEKIPSRYELVNVVAHRAREIAAEAEASGEPFRRWPTASWRPPRTRKTRRQKKRPTTKTYKSKRRGPPALAFVLFLDGSVPIKTRRE